LTGLLLLAFSLRAWGAGAALAQPCLAPPQETWLYTPALATSLYTPAPGPQVPSLPGYGSQEQFVLRWLGLICGVLTIALTWAASGRLARRWAPVLALLVALAPLFVLVDRLVVRFDAALPLVALALWLRPWMTRRSIACWAHDTALLLLLWAAPAVWWLAPALLLVSPSRQPRRWAAIGLTLLVLVPGLRTPLAWLNAAHSWDEGAAAVVVWLALLAWACWLRPMPPRWGRAVCVGLGGCLLAWTVSDIASRPQPSPDDMRWISAARERLPDGAFVALEPPLAVFAPVIACVAGGGPRFEPVVDNAFIRPPRVDFWLTRQGSPAPGAADLGGVYLMRADPLPNPSDIVFGERLRLLGFEVLTPRLNPGDTFELRYDVQFTTLFDPVVLEYGGFIHLAPPGAPQDKVVNINWPLVRELGHRAPRAENLNQRMRFAVPLAVPPGRYEVIFGIFSASKGREVGRLIVGVADITAP
jgi:hypothetical protein